ncbi:MAG: allantoinase AllB [Luteolibacter sp.]
MSTHDLIIRTDSLAVAITDGLFTEVEPEIPASAKTEINLGSSLILPGWIDSHVHFNEPGRADWEGLHTGSLALAAGGGTAFFDMPLNSSPPVTSAAALIEKRDIALEKSHLDFALWAGLTPDSLSHMEAMAAEGAIGFKAFMCHSGLDEYPAANADTLGKGMEIAARLDLPVAVHAEISHEVPAMGKDMAAWLASRPIDFELTAIKLAIALSEETGCALHIVHVTCPEGIALVTAAKQKGINVTVETCPHYLLLNEQDAISTGAPAKCAPPLRPQSTVDEMWNLLRSGHIDTIGSDHSPSSPDLKTGDDIFAIWGGIAGIQHSLPLLLDHEKNLTPQLRTNVASRFHLKNKAPLTSGHDADFFILERSPHTIAKADLLTRHPISPYIGKTFQHRITATYLRGEKVSTATKGKFLRP